MQTHTLGAFIQQRREAAGLTREQLAEQVGWAHPNSVRHVENGHTGLRSEQLLLVLEALGVPEGEWPGVLKLARPPTDEEAA